MPTQSAMANPTLTNYTIPTTLDTPRMEVGIMENPSAHGPFGAKGVGEMPMDGPAAAVVNAIRNLGLDVREIPAIPELLMDAPRIEQLHALRKAAKDLRYTLEFFRPVLSEETDALVADLVQTQDLLGALHDAEVAVGLGGELHGDRGDAGQEPSSPIGAYLADRRTRAEHVGAEFADHWSAISSPDWRARLAAVTATV